MRVRCFLVAVFHDPYPHPHPPIQETLQDCKAPLGTCHVQGPVLPASYREVNRGEKLQSACGAAIFPARGNSPLSWLTPSADHSCKYSTNRNREEEQMKSRLFWLLEAARIDFFQRGKGKSPHLPELGIMPVNPSTMAFLLSWNSPKHQWELSERGCAVVASCAWQRSLVTCPCPG